MNKQFLYLVRHGESTLSGRYCGSINADLSELGLEQAQHVGSYFKFIVLDECYVSPLMRALKTAEPIKKYHSIPFVVANEIQEMHFGEWESLTFNEIQTRWPELYNQWMADPFSVRIPKGDLFPDFLERVREFSNRMLSSQKNQIAIVAHAGVLSVLTLQLLRCPVNQFWNWISPNAAITVLSRDLSIENSQFELVVKHDAKHLKRIGIVAK